MVTPIGPPIWASVQAKDFESLKMLIAHGGDPNKDYDGKTPLMVAIQVMVDGYERLGRERFDYLIAHGADVNFEAYSEFGCSLHKVVPKPEIDENEACTKGAADFAVTFNRFDIAIELLSKGYTKHLDRLARYVAGSPVAKTSKAYREKLSLINILRQKGAKIPLMR